MYILSSTERLVRCITTLQCSKIQSTAQAGIETRLTLRYTWYLTAQPFR